MGNRASLAATNQQLLQYMQLQNQNDYHDEVTSERKRRDLELEQAKERELNIKEQASDERAVKDTFESTYGMPLDAETKKYAAPIEKNVQQRAQLRAARKAQPQEYEPQGILDRLARKPLVPKPKPGFEAPPLDEAELAAIKPQIREDTRRSLQALGYIGEDNRNNPNFDQNVHNYFMSDDTPLVPAGKALDKVKEIQNTSKLRADTRKAITEADTSEQTAPAYRRGVTLDTLNKDVTYGTALINQELERLKLARQPQVDMDAQALRTLELQLKKAEVDNIPAKREELETNIKALKLRMTKDQQEIDKIAKQNTLAEMYQTESDPTKKKNIAIQMAVNSGHAIDVMRFNEEQMNAAVGYSMEATKALTKALTLKAADKTNIDAIKSAYDTVNIASARSAALFGANTVTMYNVKADPGFGIGSPTANVEATTVGRNYAMAKLRGQVPDFIYAPTPEGATPDEVKYKILPGKAAMLGWALIDNFPGLKGNLEAYNAKIDAVPGIPEELKALTKSFIATQMGKMNQESQDKVALQAATAMEPETRTPLVPSQGRTGPRPEGDYIMTEKGKEEQKKRADITSPAFLKFAREKGVDVTKGVKGAKVQELYDEFSRTQLPPRTLQSNGKNDDEAAFQAWYKENAKGLNPNPDDPRHHYDWRAAFRAGAKSKIDPTDGLPHWPSEFKTDDHPNLVVNGVNTKTGKKVTDYVGPQGAAAAEREKDSPSVQQVRSEAVEAFKAGKRFKSPKGATFGQWLAEQAARGGTDPQNFTAQEISTYFKLWDKNR